MMMLFERIFVPIGALYKYFGTIWTVHIFMVRGRFLWLGAGHTAWAGRPAGQPAASEPGGGGSRRRSENPENAEEFLRDILPGLNRAAWKGPLSQ